ncbi:MAG: hypothetical protein JSU86_03380 [Phycisphaerales bacterium]|nr:MAG: hypothetical protein JSU86_03380 [Phycisphaerales bacterium]
MQLPASVCSKLRRQQRLIVAPLHGSGGDLVALQQTPFSQVEVAGEEWRAAVSDVGEIQLDLERPEEAELLAVLVERGLVVVFEGMSGYFNLSTSTRYWCSRRPARAADGIEMLPRISFATLPVAGEGIGIALDFSHMFRTENALDYYFASGQNPDERKRREREFDRLRGRGDRRKGTLLYDSGSQTFSQCYFSHNSHGQKCAEVGPLEFGGERYESLHDYYTKKRSSLKVKAEDPVVYVSFRAMRGEKPVAAKLLRLRVLLDPQRMPRELRANTTIAPGVRRELSEELWRKIPKEWTATAGLTVSDTLWTPDESGQELLAPPRLAFGRGRDVKAPAEASPGAYKSYFKMRREHLTRGGVFSYDEAAGRELIVVTPPESRYWSGVLQKVFVEDFVAQVSGLAARNLRAVVIRGEQVDDIVEQLRGRIPGNAVVVFNERERSAYSVLSHELSQWSLKRMTRSRIEQAWRDRREARSDRDRRRAERAWEDLLFHSAIDILDQMRATPWRLGEWAYEACLAIDVSEGRRYFGLSLLVCRPENRWPSLLRVTRTWPKGDPKYETIQPTVLADKIAGLMAELKGDAEPLSSLLVLRDGRECGDEADGIRAGLERWKEMEVLAQSAKVDVADVLKKSVKNVRLWIAGCDGASNVLEGQAVYPDEQTAIICCTGAGTLGSRGTAEPIVVRAHDGCNIRRAASGVFALSQLNYSSPTKAHRYPQPLREVDAMLRGRVDRDMRGIK